MSLLDCTSRDRPGERPDQRPGDRPDQRPDQRPEASERPDQRHQVLQRDYEKFKSSISVWQSTWEQKVNSLVQTVEFLKVKTGQLDKASLAEANMIQEVRTRFANLESQLGNRLLGPTGGTSLLAVPSSATKKPPRKPPTKEDIMKMIRMVYEDDVDRRGAAWHMPQQQELQEKCNSLQVAQEKLVAQLEGFMQEVRSASQQSESAARAPDGDNPAQESDLRSGSLQEAEVAAEPPDVGSQANLPSHVPSNGPSNGTLVSASSRIQSCSCSRNSPRPSPRKPHDVDDRSQECEVPLVKPSDNGATADPEDLPITSDAEKTCHDLSAVDLGAEDLSAEKTYHDLSAVEPTWRDEYYQFEPSIWDAALFIGTPPLGVLGSICVVMIALAAGTMQLFFSLIVFDDFIGDPFSDEVIAALKEWRVNAAHQFSYVGSTGSSLAARVCNQDSSLEVSHTQADILELVTRYRYGDHNLFGHHQGVLLCLLAITCWTLHISKNFINQRQLLRGLVELRKFKNIDGHSVTWRAGSWKLRKASNRLVALSLVILSIRAGIASCLFIGGLGFVAHEVELTDLVLNSVGLVLVLDIDELLFEVLAPAQTRRFITLLEPLHVSPFLFEFGGVDIVAVSVAVMVAAIITVSHFAYIKPQWERMADVFGAICGGNKDFAYTFSELPPKVFWATTRRYSPHHQSTDSHMWSMLQKIKRHDVGSEDWKDMQSYRLPGISGTGYSLQGVSYLSVAEVSSMFGTNCLNFDDEFNNDYTNKSHVRHAMKRMLNIESCKDAKKYCLEDSGEGTSARQVCPETCGCNVPNSSYVLNSPSVGCAVTCPSTKQYRDALREMNCFEKSPMELATDPHWMLFAESVLRASENTQPNMKRMLEVLHDDMLKAGCGAILKFRKHTQMNLCFEDAADSLKRGWPFRSFAPFCPETCLCKKSEVSEAAPAACSPQCFANSSSF